MHAADTATPASAASEDASVGRFGWGFLVPVLVGPTLNPINTSIIAVGLAPIGRALDVTASTAIWLVAVLYLTSAVAQPTMGTLADRIGPKRVYVAGLSFAALAGVLPLLSSSFAVATASRVLLGIGTSAAYPTALALIRDRSERLGIETPPALLSGLSVASLATTAVGPVLGGVLISAFGWQSVFAINIPLAGITMLLALGGLPSDAARPSHGDTEVSLRKAIDLVGIGLFAVGICAVLFFLLDLSTGTSWLLAVCVLALGALVLWERRRERPFLDVRLLAHEGALARTYLRLFLTYTTTYLFIYALSQWLQQVVGLSADQAGFAQLPTAIVAGLASLAIARSTAVRVPLIVCALVPIIGGVAFALVSAGTPLWFILVAAGLFGVPTGLASVANQAVLYRQAPPDQLGNAGGLSRTSTNLGAICASSLIGIAFGSAPSTSGMNLIGVLITVVAVLLALLTLLDAGLARASDR